MKRERSSTPRRPGTRETTERSRRLAPKSVVSTTAHAVAEGLLDSYAESQIGQRIGQNALASREEIAATVPLLLQLLYPGYYSPAAMRPGAIRLHVRALLLALEKKLARQIALCLAATHGELQKDSRAASAKGHELATRFLRALPELRNALLDDVRAAYAGDPAALSTDEVILAYPGLLAVTVYRVAHTLYLLEVPLMPRVMTEWAHANTGADIHPGATIGARFFIDHATGVVIGQTTTIGSDVKLYQGVTLGALSIPHDGDGEVVRGTKRHPTLEDDVTIYANATVLGGTTIIGAHSVIGGSVFVTKSIPPYSRVALAPPAHRIGGIANRASTRPFDEALDWSI